MRRVAHNLNIRIHVCPFELSDFAKRVQPNNAMHIGAADRARHIHLLNWTHGGKGFHFDVLDEAVGLDTAENGPPKE